jgi:prepilin-type N-terminal cleavage/methylation domain-containing protein
MRTTHPKRWRTFGFTIWELLVSMAIIGVISGLGLRTYFSAIDYYGQARSEGQADLVAQAALQSMREDITSVLPSSLTGVNIIGGLDERGGGETDSRLVLPASVPTFADGRSAAATVMYNVRRIQSNARLVRTSVPLYEDLPSDEWLNRWSADKDRSPAAIRVTLTLKEADKIRAPLITRSVVFQVPAP